MNDISLISRGLYCREFNSNHLSRYFAYKALDRQSFSNLFALDT